MKILYLTNRLPYPLHSGYLRQYYFIRELSQRHHVTLLSTVAAESPAGHVEALADCTERVITVISRGQSMHRLRKRWRRFCSAFRPDPTISTLCTVVRRLRRQETFDIAILHGLSTVAALKDLHGLPVFADLCDANSSRFLAATRYTKLFRLPVVLWDYVSARRLERKFVDSGAHLLFATPRDKQVLLQDTPRPGTVVPNGVDLDYWNRGATELGVNCIVFSGALNYPPNADAACHLIQTILPLVRQTIPNVKLLVIGRGPPRQLVIAAEKSGVTLTGMVNDIRPYLNQATVFAAPLRYGAGMQNKVLQALAMQVPVVVSVTGAEGLRAADGSEPPVDIATDCAGFAKLICRRLAAAEADRTPWLAGRKFVERHFRWSYSGQLLEQLIHSA